MRWAAGAFVLLVSTSASAADLKYYGGRVISNVKVVEIAWNASVDAGYMTQLQAFYTTIVTSSFIDWLSEYDTTGLDGFTDFQPGSNQHIGRGSFVGNLVLVPANKSNVLDDTDIQAELVAQLGSGALPAPALDKDGNVDSLYMIDFPSGVTISLVGMQSCSSFGAYHGTVKYKGMSVPYGVHPYCGYSFQTATVVHSHELVEAITDTEVGLVETNTTNPSARPLAWVTIAATAWDSEEVADLCEGTSATVAGYTVQKIWSNYAQACVSEIPICDGVLVPPACRPCTAFDDENACPSACATSGPKAGECVTCTSKDSKACAGATPACDDATYTCVACAENADCKNASAPTCDTTTHTCRGCESNAECGDAGVCDLSTDPQKNQCVACDDATQCKLGETCIAHACVAQNDGGADAGDDESGGGAGCSCDIEGAPSRAPLAGLLLGALAIVIRKRRHC
ncbi:MAG TPA: hypothetical protein VGH28_33110 [Polyangiaceae bacterium]|jgi:MYXO-CTERM domain-containing protein